MTGQDLTRCLNTWSLYTGWLSHLNAQSDHVYSLSKQNVVGNLGYIYRFWDSKFIIVHRKVFLSTNARWMPIYKTGILANVARYKWGFK